MSPPLRAPSDVNHDLARFAELVDKAEALRRVVSDSLFNHPLMPRADYDAWDRYLTAMDAQLLGLGYTLRGVAAELRAGGREGSAAAEIPPAA